MSGADPDDWAHLIDQSEIPALHGFAAQVNEFQDDFARRTGRKVDRGFHVKHHAVYRAQFRVLDDLPAQGRGGLFQPGARYDAWLRSSNGFSAPMPDWFPDMFGFAVKLLGVAGAKLVPGEERAQTQDFLALSVPYLPADDAHDLVVISLATGNFLTAPFKVLRGIGLGKTLKLLRWAFAWLPRRLIARSPLDLTYNGVVPISIGPVPVKFRWQPAMRNRFGRQLGSGAFRKDALARMSQQELRFDFLVQFFVDDQRTPVDGAWPWPVAWVKLAELVVPRGMPAPDELLAQEAQVNALAFNPWHGPEAHRPVGNIQRARGPVYQASAAHRRAEPDPVAGSCPFARRR